MENKMLILSRKLNETIVINDNIKVTLVESSNGKVRLGIDAPPEVPVYRQEIYDAIQSGKKIVKG
jgi:carbon storage regulator